MGATYTLRRSRRARSLRLTVRPGGEVVLVAPMGVPEGMLATFVARNEKWIARSVSRMVGLRALPVSGRRDYLTHRDAARSYITKLVSEWSTKLGCAHGRIAIKDTARSWGSCSHSGNLNFSYKLLFLPRELAEYVVVHELCHLTEANHSPRFWALVGAAMPAYRERRAALRRYVLR